MIEIFNRPHYVLPTDLFVAALNSEMFPSYATVKPYFDELTKTGRWGKEGGSAWLVVRGSPFCMTVDDRKVCGKFSVSDGFSSAVLKRLLTVRTEWSKK